MVKYLKTLKMPYLIQSNTMGVIHPKPQEHKGPCFSPQCHTLSNYPTSPSGRFYNIIIGAFVFCFVCLLKDLIIIILQLK